MSFDRNLSATLYWNQSLQHYIRIIFHLLNALKHNPTCPTEALHFEDAEGPNPGPPGLESLLILLCAGRWTKHFLRSFQPGLVHGSVLSRQQHSTLG